MLMQTEVKEVALAMPGLSSDFGISRTCDYEYCIVCGGGIREAGEEALTSGIMSFHHRFGGNFRVADSRSFVRLYISDSSRQSELENRTGRGRAWCSTLKMNARLRMALGKISKLRPGIPVPFRGVGAFERDAVVSLA